MRAEKPYLRAGNTATAIDRYKKEKGSKNPTISRVNTALTRMNRKM
jgi:hypothetical protein